MQEITLKLSLEEVNAIINFMGELPTKSGIFPLAMKIKSQTEEQLPRKDKVE
jgi:hypothetical protein